MQLPDGSRGAPPASLAQGEKTEPRAPVAHPSAKAGAAPAQRAKTGLGLVKAIAPKASEPAGSPAPPAAEGGRPFTSGVLPEPALKPLDVVPVAAASTGPNAGDEPTSLDAAMIAPPAPALKPVILSRQRTEPLPAQGEPPSVGDQSLPDALQAWWANVKILLASGPAPADRRAGGDDSDRGARQASVGGEPAAGGRPSDRQRDRDADDGAGRGSSGRGPSGGGGGDAGGGAGGGGGAGSGAASDPGGGAGRGGDDRGGDDDRGGPGDGDRGGDRGGGDNDRGDN